MEAVVHFFTPTKYQHRYLTYVSGFSFLALSQKEALQSLLGVRKWLLQGRREGRGMGPAGPRMGRALNHKQTIALIK